MPIEIFFSGKQIDRFDAQEVCGGPFTLHLEIRCEENVRVVCEDPRLVFEKGTDITVKDGRGKLEVIISVTDEPLETVINFLSASETLEFRFPVRIVPGKSAPESFPEERGRLNPAVPQLPQGDFFCKQCGCKLPDKRPYCSTCRKAAASSFPAPEDANFLSLWLKDAAHKRLFIGVCLFLVLFILFFLMKPKGEMGIPANGVGDLLITSDPKGALVISLDNKFQNAPTPLLLRDMPAGLYKFSFRMQDCGGDNEIHGVTVSSEGPVHYKAELAKFGAVEIKTVPPGAEIFFDGIKLGQRTPYTLKRVPEGKHDISLVFNASVKRNASVDVRWKQTGEIFLLPDETKAGLDFGLPDDCKIFMDGSYVGKTPLPPLLLNPGTHSFSIISEQSLPLKGEIVLQPGLVTAFSPPMKYYGVLEVKSTEAARLYVGENYFGSLPAKVYCPPDRKVVLDVWTDDGRNWKQGFILREGEKRIVSAKLPKSLPKPSPDWGSYIPEPVFVPHTDFSGFDLTRRFPASSWKKLEQIYDDIDQDGEAEMILAFTSLISKGQNGHQVHLFVVKKHDKVFFDVIPLKNPRLGCIGEGELLNLDIVRSDRYGYREIVYACGTVKSGIRERGAFVIYQGKCYSPQWTKGS